jgi:hypothetical protein
MFIVYDQCLYMDEKSGVEARAVFGDKYNPLRVNNHLWRGKRFFRGDKGQIPFGRKFQE